MPWLLGGLLLLEVAVSAAFVKSWREAKRSPYFFLRQQASKRMRRYMGATAVLFLVTVAVSAFAFQTTESYSPRFAPLSHAKPLPQQAVAEASPSEVEAANPQSVEVNFSANGPAKTLAELEVPLLPPAANEPSQPAEPSSATTPAQEPALAVIDGSASISNIAFSTDIADNFQAIEPGRRFIEGYFTLYATFSYQEMVEGTKWGWTWKHNGQVLEGEEQIWSYGESGPGYIYFTPDSGFQQGEYTLEVWVENTLMSQANFMVTDGIAASN